MINAYEIPEIVEAMAYDSSNMNPFGKRFWGDRRYRVFCKCGYGNAHHDTIYGYVGTHQFELTIDYDNGIVKCRMLRREELFTH